MLGKQTHHFGELEGEGDSDAGGDKQRDVRAPCHEIKNAKQKLSRTLVYTFGSLFGKLGLTLHEYGREYDNSAAKIHRLENVLGKGYQ